MNKHWGIHFFVVGFMLVYALTVFADQQTKQDLEATQEALLLLTETMKKSGAETERIQLHYGSAYQTFESVEEVKKFAEKLGTEMGLTEHEQSFNEQSIQIHYNSLKGNNLTKLQVSAMPSHSGSDNWESYIIVNVSTGSSDLDTLQLELSKVYKVLENVNIVPQFYTCVQGNLSDTLENDVQTKTLSNILDYMGAEVIEKAEDSTVKSFSAYTSRLSTSIITGGRKMNVQAGIHADQLHGITRLTIGTPIITIEY